MTEINYIFLGAAIVLLAYPFSLIGGRASHRNISYGWKTFSAIVSILGSTAMWVGIFMIAIALLFLAVS